MRNPEFGIVQFSLFSRKNRSFSVGQDQGLHRCGRQAAAFQPAEFSKEGSPLFPRSKESKILCTAIPAQDPEPTQGARAVSRFLRRGGYQPPVPILSIAILRAADSRPYSPPRRQLCQKHGVESLYRDLQRSHPLAVFKDRYFHGTLPNTPLLLIRRRRRHRIYSLFTIHSSLFTNQKRPAPMYEAERPFYAIVIP